jgi:hypothetical protein
MYWESLDDFMGIGPVREKPKKKARTEDEKSEDEHVELEDSDEEEETDRSFEGTIFDGPFNF